MNKRRGRLYARASRWSNSKLSRRFRVSAREIPAGLGPTYGDLRFNPCWDDLRGDPRFDKIVAAAKAASR